MGRRGGNSNGSDDDGPRDYGEELVEKLLAELKHVSQLGPVEYRRAIKLLEPKALRVLDSLLGNPLVRPDVRAKIAQDVLDRVHGKATQHVEISEAQRKLESMSDEELHEYVSGLLEQIGIAGRVQVLPNVPRTDGSVN